MHFQFMKKLYNGLHINGLVFLNMLDSGICIFLHLTCFLFSGCLVTVAHAARVARILEPGNLWWNLDLLFITWNASRVSRVTISLCPVIDTVLLMDPYFVNKIPRNVWKSNEMFVCLEHKPWRWLQISALPFRRDATKIHNYDDNDTRWNLEGVIKCLDFMLLVITSLDAMKQTQYLRHSIDWNACTKVRSFCVIAKILGSKVGAVFSVQCTTWHLSVYMYMVVFHV